jgi:hypothetical protein
MKIEIELDFESLKLQREERRVMQALEDKKAEERTTKNTKLCAEQVALWAYDHFKKNEKCESVTYTARQLEDALKPEGRFLLHKVEDFINNNYGNYLKAKSKFCEFGQEITISI